MTFKNTKIFDFLEKQNYLVNNSRENFLLFYFEFFLRNPNVTIVSIKQLKDESISVIFGSEFGFTSETYEFIQSDCSAQISNSTLMEMYDRMVGLKLEKCSMMASASIIQPNSTSYANVTRTLFVKLEIDDQISNASDSCTIKLSIFLLAIVCTILNHYLHQALSITI